MTIEKTNGGLLNLAIAITGLFSMVHSRFAIALIQLENVNGIWIFQCPIENLAFDGRLPKDGNLAVNQCEFNSFGLMRVKNMGSMEFTQVTFKKDVQFVASDLGKCDFILCSFSDARCIFSNNKFNELFLAETDFPERIYSTNDTADYVQEQLVFGQLRNVYDRMGDTARSLEYHSRELHAQYKLLGWGSKVFPWINFTKLNLALSYFSNDFGRNWARAILVSIGAGMVLFYALTISTELYQIDWAVSFDGTLVKAFSKFMNPLRTFQTESLLGDRKVGITGWSGIIDFVSRVIIAYCYYQVIQAFRRYGRK